MFNDLVARSINGKRLSHGGFLKTQALNFEFGTELLAKTCLLCNHRYQHYILCLYGVNRYAGVD